MTIFNTTKAEIRISGRPERVSVFFPYSPIFIEKIKAFEGRRWHPKEKFWSVPYSELRNLLTVFDGEKVEVDASVWLYELEKQYPYHI